jgi:hypothetical protein
VVTGGRRDAVAVEGLLFTLVAQRALAPDSKLAAVEWANRDIDLPDVDDVGGDPQVFYRATDFLLEADEQVQLAVFTAAANLLNLEVDLLALGDESPVASPPGRLSVNRGSLRRRG